MNDLTHKPTNAAQVRAMRACMVAAIGFISPPERSGRMKLNAPPRKPTSPIMTATCMACFRQPSWKASAPKMINGKPKNAGISHARPKISDQAQDYQKCADGNRDFGHAELSWCSSEWLQVISYHSPPLTTTPLPTILMKSIQAWPRSSRSRTNH